MFQLRCTVRNCQELLVQEARELRCAAGHHFDRAKQGHWNLMQPQDSKSRSPGDCDEAVLARHRWLQRGYANGLIESLKPWISTPADRSEENRSERTIDLGCGEGSFGPALFADHADDYCGIDLSKRAIKLAARRWPEATWVLANADRILPAANASVHRVLSLFGRRPNSEIARVLAPGGVCIIAVPSEEDLIELREQVQQSGHRRSRWEMVVEELGTEAFEFVEHKCWQETVLLQPDAIADALAMTYRAVRHSQQDRLQEVAAMDVTLGADLVLLRRTSSTSSAD